MHSDVCVSTVSIHDYLEAFPNAPKDALRLVENGHAVFDGEFFHVRDYAGCVGSVAWTTYSMGDYFQTFHPMPYSKLKYKKKAVEEVLGIHGITEDEASLLLEEGTRSRQDTYAKALQERFPNLLGIEGSIIEEVCGISRQERLNWTKEGLLKVVYSGNHKAALYDRIQLFHMTPELLDEWRLPPAEREALQAERRKRKYLVSHNITVLGSKDKEANDHYFVLFNTSEEAQRYIHNVTDMANPTSGKFLNAKIITKKEYHKLVSQFHKKSDWLKEYRRIYSYDDIKGFPYIPDISK